MWLQSILKELKLDSGIKSTVWCDNQSTLYMTANLILHCRTKHIEIDLYFIRDQVQRENLQLSHIPATHQKADTFTKPLSRNNFVKFRSELIVVENQISSEFKNTNFLQIEEERRSNTRIVNLTSI